VPHDEGVAVEPLLALLDAWDEYDQATPQMQALINDQRWLTVDETRELVVKLDRVGLDGLTALGDRRSGERVDA
jgi:hypothetical protein